MHNKYGLKIYHKQKKVRKKNRGKKEPNYIRLKKIKNDNNNNNINDK